MTDLASMAAALGALKNANELVGIIRQSGISLKNAEIQYKTAELISTLAEVKVQLADVREVILERDQSIRDLNARLELKGKLTFKHPFYWMEGEPTPFCQQCYDSGSKAIRLQGDGEGYWECKTCKNHYIEKASSAIGAAVVRNTRRDYDPFGDT